MSYVPSFSQMGIGSGINFDDMLTKLRQVENNRLVPYTNQQTSCKNQVSAWGAIKNSLNDFQKSVTALNGSAFNTFTANDTKAFSVTTNSNAFEGVHKVIVKNLATAGSGISTGVDDRTAQMGSSDAKITITQKNGEPPLEIDLKADETSLDQVVKKINGAGGDVTASVVFGDDGKAALKLTSKSTGADNSIDSVQVTGNSDLQSFMGTVKTTDGVDAKIDIDGQEVNSASNTIKDVIPGVTLTLKAMSEDQTNGEQLVLNKDSSAVKDAIKDFVEKFNALNSKINTSRYSDVAANATSGSKKSDDDDKNKVPDGALVSDSTIRDLASALLGTAAGSVTGNGNHDVMSLSDIGISIDAKTGEMKIDETKLDTVLETNGNDVQKMLMGAGDKPGLADSLLKDVANKYLGDSASGTKSIIDDTTKGLNDKLKTLQTQIDRTNDLIDSQMDVYTKQFQNLDKIMTQMQGTSSALIAALGGQ